MKMKKYICLILLFFFFYSTAYADPYTAPNTISIDVPQSWQASYNENYKQILVTPPDKQAGVGIMVIDSGGKSSLEIAEMMSREMKGSAPKQVEGAENHYFSANIDGMESRFIFLGKDSKVLIYSEFGDLNKYDNESQHIWQSMKSSDPKIQGLFDSIIQGQ